MDTVDTWGTRAFALISRASLRIIDPWRVIRGDARELLAAASSPRGRCV